MEREVVIMGIQIAFPSGVRVLSRTGEVLQQFTADEPVTVRHGLLVRRILSKREWIRRELAKASFSAAQTALMKRLKFDLLV
jgi:hypothetical protein